MITKLVVIALYATMIIIIGILGLRKTHSFNDFFLGGGKVGPWMTAFSYGTAYFSAVLFIGFAGKIGWNHGYSGLWIALFNAFIGVLMVWGIFGWRIKKISGDYNVSTMCEYLEKRYDSRFLKFFGALVIFIFMIPYSAAVFMGLSYLFTSNFNIEYWHALLFIGIFTASYIVLGGYKSMAMIDMIFGIIMTGGVIILYFSTVNEGGGLNMITNTLREIEPKLTKSVGPPGFWSLFSLIFLTSIAPFAMPQLVQKFYAIRDRRSIRIGMLASTFFALLIGGVAYFIGSTTRVFISPGDPAFSQVFNGSEPIYDRLMPELLAKVIPESLSVIILLLILSASMSTLAALVLISSSSLTKDFYHGFINKQASDKKLTLLMRISSAFFVFLSVMLAWLDLDTIVAILGISWGALGSFFLGPFIWGMLMKRATRSGAILSGLLGLATCLTLYFWGMPSPSAGTIGMITSLILNPLISLMMSQKAKYA
jgi:SSS family solute:Na+ symporter/sodium/proline symporter